MSEIFEGFQILSEKFEKKFSLIIFWIKFENILKTRFQMQYSQELFNLRTPPI